MEAAKGCNKDITARTQVICDRCDGKRAEPGTTYSTCSTCKGTGQVLIFFFFTHKLTVRTLKTGHLEEDCPITTFSETNDFQVFCKQTNNIHKFQRVWKFSTIMLLSLECNWSVHKKILEGLLFPENVVMGQSKVSQFECPHCNIVLIKSQNWSAGLVWFFVSFQWKPFAAVW